MYKSYSFCGACFAAIFPQGNQRYSVVWKIYVWFHFKDFISIIDQEQAERKITKQESEYSDSEFPNKLRNISIAALISLVAMTAYAMSTGIIQVIWNPSLIRVDESPAKLVIVYFFFRWCQQTKGKKKTDYSIPIGWLVPVLIQLFLVGICDQVQLKKKKKPFHTISQINLCI